MFTRFWKLTAASLSLIIITGCSLFDSGTKSTSDTVVGTVNDKPVTYGELRSSFFISPAQDDEDPETTNQELREFLSLYLDYRAKIEAAREAGYFEMDEIQQELKNYQMQSVYPFWLENKIRDELLDELVDRSKKEIRVTHMLITLQENATPSDTLDAYNRLTEARDLYLSGEESFEDISERVSSRQMGRTVGGDLGYISGGWAVKPFEDVAYNTPVDSVSMPFRTSFGMHILKVEDRRETVPQRKFSHIFFQTRGQNVSPDRSREKAQEAFTAISDGMSWADAVVEYTMDTDSKNREGEIGWIDESRFEPRFIRKINEVTEPGEISEPFESEYGIHIVRLDSIRTYRDEQHLREELYERLRNLPRYRENKASVHKSVRQNANERVHSETYDSFDNFVQAHSSTDFGDIPWPEELLYEPFYTIDGVTYPLQHFVEFVEEKVEGRRNKQYRHTYLNDYKNAMAEKIVVDVTKRVFPEFDQLSQTYHEGLAVFKITEDSVWTRSMQDTTALRNIFDENRDDFRFGTRYRFYRLSADSEERLHDARTIVNHGLPIDSIRAAVDGLILRTDTINSLDSFPFDHLQGLEPGEFTDVFEYRNRDTILYLAEIMEPRRMEFEEAFMQVVSVYQPILEEEWVQSLRDQYRVTPRPERLEAILSQRDQ